MASSRLQSGDAFNNWNDCCYHFLISDRQAESEMHSNTWTVGYLHSFRAETDGTVTHVWRLKAATTLQNILLCVIFFFFQFFIFFPPSLHCCCWPVKTPLMFTETPPWGLPPTLPQPVNIKRWCILQSMLVTLLCCYPSFLLGPQWGSWGSVPGTVHHWGRGNLCGVCTFVLCMRLNVCWFLLCVWVCSTFLEIRAWEFR